MGLSKGWGLRIVFASAAVGLRVFGSENARAQTATPNPQDHLSLPKPVVTTSVISELQPLSQKLASKAVAWDDTAINADGTHYAYPDVRGFSQVLVVDGKDSPEYDQVKQPRMGSTGEFTSYWAKKDGKTTFVLASHGEFNPLPAGNGHVMDRNLVEYSDDLDRIITVQHAQAGPYTLHSTFDGKTFGPYHEVDHIQVSRDGHHFAFCFLPGGDAHPVNHIGHHSSNGQGAPQAAPKAESHWTLNVDGNETPLSASPTDSINDIQVSSGYSRQIVSGLSTDRRNALWLDGKIVESASKVISFGFDPTGKHAWWLKNTGNAQSLIVDSQPVAEYSAIASLTFSPDGKAVAFLASKNDKSAVFAKPLPRETIDPEIQAKWTTMNSDVRSSAEWTGAMPRFGGGYQNLEYLSSTGELFNNGQQVAKTEPLHQKVTRFALLPQSSQFVVDSDSTLIVNGVQIPYPYAYRLRPDANDEELLSILHIKPGVAATSFWYVGTDKANHDALVRVDVKLDASDGSPAP